MFELMDGKYTIRKDPYNWILEEHYEGKDRDGETVMRSRQTYHGSLHQAAKKIIDNEMGNCKDAEELHELLTNIHRKTYEEMFKLQKKVMKELKASRHDT